MTLDIFLINFKFYALMKKENFLSDDFLKQFKTGDKLTSFGLTQKLVERT